MKAWRGFQKPLSQPGSREVNMAMINYHENDGVTCSCGWAYQHRRAKVVEDAIDRHIDKRHHGRGIRL